MSKLSERSKKLRLDIIKLSKANGGYHYGGSFSCVEILLSLFDHVLDNESDKFIMSKGHACWGYYVLLMEKGFSPLLEGHPHRDIHNGVMWTTGSEGHGFPAALGMSLAKKMKKEKGEIYVLIGDGECQEGTTWESLLMGNQHKLNNLTVIVDYNKIQGSGFIKDILDMSSIPEVAKAVGWKVSKVDGHNIEKLSECLFEKKDKPHLVFADTIKGKGVSFMENQPKWHANWPSPEYEERALKELST
jgi:transketolase